jgi:hypothetical protein
MGGRAVRKHVVVSVGLLGFAACLVACTEGNQSSPLAVEILPSTGQAVVHVFTCPGDTNPIRSLGLSQSYEGEDDVAWKITSDSGAGVDVQSVQIGVVPEGFERLSGEATLDLDADREYLVQMDVGAHVYTRFTSGDMVPGRLYWDRDSGSRTEWRANQLKDC